MFNHTTRSMCSMQRRVNNDSTKKMGLLSSFYATNSILINRYSNNHRIKKQHSFLNRNTNMISKRNFSATILDGVALAEQMTEELKGEVKLNKRKKKAVAFF